MKVIGRTEGGLIVEINDREAALLTGLNRSQIGETMKPGSFINVEPLWDHVHALRGYKTGLTGIADGLVEIAQKLRIPESTVAAPTSAPESEPEAGR